MEMGIRLSGCMDHGDVYVSRRNSYERTGILSNQFLISSEMWRIDAYDVITVFGSRLNLWKKNKILKKPKS